MTADILALGAVLAVIALIFVATVRTGISPLPTSAAVRDAMLATLPLDLAGPVYELGSGWGGLAQALARRYPSCSVLAYEVSLLPWAFSRLRRMILGPANLHVRLADFHNADVSDAALVVCFLCPPGMEKLKRKLEAELKPGALVLSNTFAVRGWRPIDTGTVADMHASRVYLYEMGRR